MAWSGYIDLLFFSASGRRFLPSLIGVEYPIYSVFLAFTLGSHRKFIKASAQSSLSAVCGMHTASVYLLDPSLGIIYSRSSFSSFISGKSPE